MLIIFTVCLAIYDNLNGWLEWFNVVMYNADVIAKSGYSVWVDYVIAGCWKTYIKALPWNAKSNISAQDLLELKYDILNNQAKDGNGCIERTIYGVLFG